VGLSHLLFEKIGGIMKTLREINNKIHELANNDNPFGRNQIIEATMLSVLLEINEKLDKIIEKEVVQEKKPTTKIASTKTTAK
jgi:hypothetical protein